MNKKILLLTLLGTLVLPVLASAQADTSTIANNIKQVAVNIGIAIVVIGWVIAGILYLTAAGAPEKMKTAKTAMVAAIIGTALVIFAVGGYNVIKGIVDSALNSGS